MISVLIPARGGSKGIRRKNLIRLDPNDPDSSLLSISIRHGFELANLVYVSTEDPEIAEIARGAETIVIERPDHLANDTASTEDVIKHALPQMSGDYIILLQPTSPLRMIDCIKKQLPDFVNGYYDSGLSVCEIPFVRDWKGKLLIDSCRKRRQERQPKYMEDGAFYIFTRDIQHRDDRVFGNIMLFKTAACDIDNQIDLEFARRCWNGIKND